jgi:hypothetical protein
LSAALAAAAAAPAGALVGGFWPSAPENITLTQFYALAAFMTRSNLSLLFDLNELYGRNCNTTRPGCPSCSDWCGLPADGFPPWDTSNVRAFLQRLHDDGAAGGANALFGFEVGNELAGHLDPAQNARDVVQLSGIIGEIWADAPASQRPGFYAPSTDNCWTQDTLHIMQNVTGHVTGFTFHGYPAGDGHNLLQLLTNASWLRSGIMSGSDAQACIADWNGAPRAEGMQLWVTEASSSWNWAGATDPPWPPGMPAQNSFMHGFFTIPELGQYARAGVPVVARWCHALGGSFSTLDYDKQRDRFDVAADFWVMLAQKRLMGDAVLAVTGDDAPGSAALVYAQCAAHSALVAAAAPPFDLGLARHVDAGRPALEILGRLGAVVPVGGGGGNGSVSIMAVNVAAEAASLTLLADGGSGAHIATTPRLEWVFTAPGGNISALSSLLNDDGGGAGVPLRINADGSLPQLPARYVPAGGPEALTLPPMSQAFFVLLAADAPACGGAAAADAAAPRGT